MSFGFKGFRIQVSRFGVYNLGFGGQGFRGVDFFVTVTLINRPPAPPELVLRFGLMEGGGLNNKLRWWR